MSELICPECGVQMMRGGRYCHQCGFDSRNPGSRSRGSGGRPVYQRRMMAGLYSLIALIGLLFFLVPRDSLAGSIGPGVAAPNFELAAVGGEPVQLSQFRGQVVVLNFWASWCPPCRAEMPDLQRLNEAWQAEGEVVLLGINLEESEITVRQFAEHLGVTFPLLLDTNGAVTDTYKLLPLPTTFVIDGDGIIRAKLEGQIVPAHLLQEVEAAKQPLGGT